MSRSGDAAVGMMDGAYFVGRKELLDFFNDLLDLQLTKIEQTAPGAIACQLTELIFRGSVPMSKVNWEAKSDYEFVQNYKLLQNAFTKHHVQRYVDVNKLIRAKYQDNLEFCQWLKAFYDQSGVFREDYDPVVVRSRGKGGKRYKFNKTGAAPSRTARPATTTRAKAPVATAAKARPDKPVATKSAAKKATRDARPLRERQGTASGKTAIVASEDPDPALLEKIAELEAQNTELKASCSELERTSADLQDKTVELETNNESLTEAVMDIEKERDFYFGKLRNVEVLLQIFQEGEGSDPTKVIDDVFKILYAAAEDNLTVDQNGEVVADDSSPPAVDVSVSEELEEFLDAN